MDFANVSESSWSEVPWTAGEVRIVPGRGSARDWADFGRTFLALPVSSSLTTSSSSSELPSLAFAALFRRRHSEILANESRSGIFFSCTLCKPCNMSSKRFAVGETHLLGGGIPKTGEAGLLREAAGELGADLESICWLFTLSIALWGRGGETWFCFPGDADAGRPVSVGRRVPPGCLSADLSGSPYEETSSFGSVTEDKDLRFGSWGDRSPAVEPWPRFRPIVSTKSVAGAELFRIMAEPGLDGDSPSSGVRLRAALICCSSFCRFSYLFLNAFMDWICLFTSVCKTPTSAFILCSAIALRTRASFSVDVSFSCLALLILATFFSSGCDETENGRQRFPNLEPQWTPSIIGPLCF